MEYKDCLFVCFRFANRRIYYNYEYIKNLLIKAFRAFITRDQGEAVASPCGGQPPRFAWLLSKLL